MGSRVNAGAAGFASEGAARATAFAFEDLGLSCLRATVLRSNVASRRILERLGFKVSEFGVKAVPRYGGPPRVGDVHLLERRDWLANRQKPNLRDPTCQTVPSNEAPVSASDQPVISAVLAS